MKMKKISVIYFPLAFTLLFGITSCSMKMETTTTTALSVESGTVDVIVPIQPESTAESEASSISHTVDGAVSEAIMDYNAERYPSNYETCGEGHLILDTMTEGDVVTVHALTMYGTYQFQDGNFVKDGGTGAIPAVIQLRKENDGTLKLEDYQEPLDGGLYEKSIRSMFPEKLWDRCLIIQEGDKAELKKQELAYAETYLKNIGREAAIGDYRDFPHTIPSDVGISAEVSNKIDESRKQENGPQTYAPFWFGTVEQIENGIRYIYEHRYDDENKEIVFSKINYQTRKTVEEVVFDSSTGEYKN